MSFAAKPEDAKMKILVTGATGLIGKHVVAALLQAGHQVRALGRKSSNFDSQPWNCEVEIVVDDLLTTEAIPDHLRGIDIVIHLAAKLSGTDEEIISTAEVGTAKLLSAASQTSLKHFVLVSSLSVYNWDTAKSPLDEHTAMEPEAAPHRGAYAVAKIKQERLVRDSAVLHRCSILRPGFVWSSGDVWCDGIGDRRGWLATVIGPSRRVPMTSVENCAHAIATIATSTMPRYSVFNIVDHDTSNAWTRASAMTRKSDRKPFQIAIPYRVGLAVAWLAWGAASLLGIRSRLPSILVPRRFVARFKPIEVSGKALENFLAPAGTPEIPPTPTATGTPVLEPRPRQSGGSRVN